MNKPNVSKLIKNARFKASKHYPEILTGFGIAGMITTTILAVRATPKAIKLIEEEKNRQNYILAKEARDKGMDACGQVDKLKPTEVVKVAWQCYIPATITGIVSTACLIGASTANVRRNATLAAAYKLSEAALTEYKEKVVETIGEKKERAVRDKIAKDKIDENPVRSDNIIITNKGDNLCFDTFSGRYFKSDIEKIKKAENVLNKNMLSLDYVSLNDFYGEIGLDYTDIGYDLGWRVDDGLIEIYFSSQIADNGEPCIVVDFEQPPRYGYSKIV